MKKIIKTFIAVVFAAAISVNSLGTLSFKAFGAEKKASDISYVNFNGHTYALFESGMSWKDAEAYCKKLGGHLATIGGSKEQKFLEKLMQNGKMLSYWIGFRYYNGKWKWVDDTKFSYQNWSSSQPDNYYGSEYYGMIYSKSKIYSGWNIKKGAWNDSDNMGGEGDFELSKIGFICEWDKVKLVKRKYNGHSYAVINSGMSWTDAKAFCEKQGGHLVTIGNKDEQKFVEGLIDDGYKNAYWIGLKLSGKKWSWIDKTKFKYTNWNKSLPDNKGGNENYGMMYPQSKKYSGYSVDKGKWNDAANKADGSSGDFAVSKLGFICEWD